MIRQAFMNNEHLCDHTRFMRNILVMSTKIDLCFMAEKMVQLIWFRQQL